MTVEQILAALEPATSEHISSSPSSHPLLASASKMNVVRLTAREVDVLRLLVQGLTDAQIAEQLVISPRTVNAHLTSIYRKLGATSRTTAARYALEQQLF